MERYWEYCETVASTVIKSGKMGLKWGLRWRKMEMGLVGIGMGIGDFEVGFLKSVCE